MKTVIVTLLFISGLAYASVLEVGPITLTGSGVLTDPDWASYGGDGFGGLGLILHATGSNGTDTVSISTQDIELLSNDSQDYQLNTLVFDASPFQCLQTLTVTNSLCSITIDGITGYGAFSGIGGGLGLVQVYAESGQPGGLSYPGSLLAEAQITNTQVEVGRVTCGSGQFVAPRCPGGIGSWTATFSVADPPSQVPEPGSFMLLAFGVVAVMITRRPMTKARRQQLQSEGEREATYYAQIPDPRSADLCANCEHTRDDHDFAGCIRCKCGYFKEQAA